MTGSEDLHRLLESYSSYAWAPQSTDALSNGYVLYQWTAHKKYYTHVVANICSTLGLTNSQVNCTSVRLQLKRTVDKYNQLKRNIGRNWRRIEEYLSSSFQIPTPTPQHVPTISEDPNPASVNSCSSPKKLRKNCDVCPLQRNNNAKLAEQLRLIKSEKRRTVAEIKRQYKTKVINQRLNRHLIRRTDLVATVSSLEKKCELLFVRLNSKRKEIKKLQGMLSVHEGTQRRLFEENASFKSETEQLKRDVAEKDRTIHHLTCLLEEQNKEAVIIESRPSKSYIASVRLCIYKGLLCHVPVSHIGQLVSYIAHTLGGKSLSQTPSQTTIAQMAYELGVLSLVQLSDFLLHRRNLCLSWDATSLDGSHVNEIHVTADQTQCMTIDIQSLPGGTAQDYTTHVVTALSDAASTYSQYCGIPEAEVSAKIHRAMTSTVTDRAAVNHATVVKLQDALGCQLLELNCNVHPLDSMASASRSALSTFDKETDVTGRCLGRNGAATNCIMAVSKLRFKQGTGDPGGFKTHFRQLGVPIGTFVRYVGNRMHILFHLGGVLTAQRQNLLGFVGTHKTGIKNDIKHDLENPLIMVQLKALGLMGKVVTGPWMTKFYSNDSNLDMVPRIKEGKDLLDTWCANPSEVAHPEHNIFGEPLKPSDDPVLSALLCSDSSADMLTDVLGRLLQAIRSVYIRQLSRYLDPADLAEPSEHQILAASSAPSHNMASERALGMTDAHWKRAPNATQGFINGKVKSTLNRTLEWLEERADKEKLVSFAVSEGHRARQREQRRKAALERELKRRQDVGRQQRDTANRNKVASQIKIALEEKTLDACLASFSFPKETSSLVEEISRAPSIIVGRLMEHIWFDLDEGEESWYGRVSEVEDEDGGRVRKRRKTGKSVSISYWSKSDMESNSEDYTIPLEQLLTDILLGDLFFIN